MENLVKESAVGKNNPTNKFTQNILKSIVGTEKAHNAFASISMAAIPNVVVQNSISLEVLKKAQSFNEIGNQVSSRLEFLKEILDKKPKDKKQGIDKYITDEASDSNDSFEEAQGEFKSSLEEVDVTQLIDIELVKLLKYCYSLTEARESEQYQDEIMNKAIELGKKTHDKLLIFDMDETLIAAKFGDKLPAKFEKTFSYFLSDIEVSVRLRPYVIDSLEKLSTMYEIIVFTAG